MSRPRVFRMKAKFALGQEDPFSRGFFAIFITAEPAIDVNQKTWRLIIVWSAFGRALEKRGCSLLFALLETDSRQKVMGLEGTGIQGDGLLQFLLGFLILA